MAKLIYSTLASLDGFVEDSQGRFDWAAPDEEVHAFVNDLERPIGTYLYGRRMYETMMSWQTVSGDRSAVTRDFAEIWQSADKIVYSRTLRAISTPKTTLERAFDPAAVARLKDRSGADISVGGATLAGEALTAGLVDECQLFLCPVLVGGGTRALPENVFARLELAAVRRFASGVVYLNYVTTSR